MKKVVGGGAPMFATSVAAMPDAHRMDGSNFPSVDSLAAAQNATLRVPMQLVAQVQIDGQQTSIQIPYDTKSAEAFFSSVLLDSNLHNFSFSRHSTLAKDLDGLARTSSGQTENDLNKELTGLGELQKAAQKARKNDYAEIFRLRSEVVRAVIQKKAELAANRQASQTPNTATTSTSPTVSVVPRVDLSRVQPSFGVELGGVLLHSARGAAATVAAGGGAIVSHTGEALGSARKLVDNTGEALTQVGGVFAAGWDELGAQTSRLLGTESNDSANLAQVFNRQLRPLETALGKVDNSREALSAIQCALQHLQAGLTPDSAEHVRVTALLKKVANQIRGRELQDAIETARRDPQALSEGHVENERAKQQSVEAERKFAQAVEKQRRRDARKASQVMEQAASPALPLPSVSPDAVPLVQQPVAHVPCGNERLTVDAYELRVRRTWGRLASDPAKLPDHLSAKLLTEYGYAQAAADFFGDGKPLSGVRLLLNDGRYIDQNEQIATGRVGQMQAVRSGLMQRIQSDWAAHVAQEEAAQRREQAQQSSTRRPPVNTPRSGNEGLVSGFINRFTQN